MASTIRRSILMSAVIMLALSNGISTQTLLSQALSDLSRYLGAATRLLASAIGGFEKVEAAAVAAADRPQVVKELRTIVDQVTTLRVSQAPLIKDLTDYVVTVRKHGVATDDDVERWKLILSSAGRVSGIVRDTYRIVRTGTWMTVAVSADDRVELDETLVARSDVLSRLRTLPAPSTSQEIDQLQRMNDRYKELFESLGRLNIALTRAMDQFQQK